MVLTERPDFGSAFKDRVGDTHLVEEDAHHQARETGTDNDDPKRRTRKGICAGHVFRGNGVDEASSVCVCERRKGMFERKKECMR